MPSEKKRLYVALYPSGVVGDEERKFHWGFLIGPKAETGTDVPGIRYDVKNHPLNGWEYEERNLSDVRSTHTLLAQVVIAKVQDEGRLVELFRKLPVNNDDPYWRCRTWIGQALGQIARDQRCVGTSELDWAKIEAFARQYVAQKPPQGGMQETRTC